MKTFDIIITNGNVALTDQVVNTQIGIKNGKIVAIGNELSGTDKYIDAEGMYVLPGVVDAHIHICEPGRTHWEGFETGTKALAVGGTTCYIDMPLNNLPATIDGETLNIKLESAKNKNYVDYALYGGVVPHNLDKLAELDKLGVVGYKCFMATCGFGVNGDFKDINDYELLKGMQEIKKLGQTLSIHAENATICDVLAKEYQLNGKTDVNAYVNSRPDFTEVDAVRRALYLGKITGCKLHFVHLSCAKSIHEVLKARADGMEVTIESCPHYLNLNSEIFANKLLALGKCSPPLRSKEETEKMWNELIYGNIDILTSDHSPCPPDMKQSDDGNIFKAWGGLSASQNVLDIMFDEAVQKRGMSVTKLMQVLSTNPAKIFGLKNKGAIALGKDADIVFLKPNSPYTLTTDLLQYRHKHSPYVGYEIGCMVMKTILRGNVIYNRNEGIIGEAIGTYVKKDTSV